MTREEYIKFLVKQGYSGREILRQLRGAGFRIGNDKLYRLVREYRESDEVKEELVRDLTKQRFSVRQIGDIVRSRQFRISNDKLYEFIKKYRKYICVKDNILKLVERRKEFGIGNYPWSSRDILELTEHKFFGVYSECEEFEVKIYIGQNREEELTFSKLKFLYHLILTKVLKLKLREGCCEGGTELENFTLQLAFKYDRDYVFDERDLCKKMLYDILEILSDKTCREDDEEGLERWIEYLHNYVKKTEEWGR